MRLHQADPALPQSTADYLDAYVQQLSDEEIGSLLAEEPQVGLLWTR